MHKYNVFNSQIILDSSNESCVILASYSIADPETEENSRNLSLSLARPFCQVLANEAFQATNRRGDFVMRAHARAFAAKSAGVVIQGRGKGRAGGVRDRDQDREPTTRRGRRRELFIAAIISSLRLSIE